MKTLIGYTLSLVLMTTATAAVAKPKHHKARGHAYGHDRHEYRHDDRHGHGGHHCRESHHRHSHHYSHGFSSHHDSHRDHHRRDRHDFGDHVPYIIGGAIVGAVLSTKARSHHYHDGRVCYSGHGG
jgi:hypothetical protein